MADGICRTLRDGGSEGEHAPALTINDTISCPLGSFVFDHILSQLASFIFFQKSNSNLVEKRQDAFTSGIVLVAFSRSPLYYEQLLKSKGYDNVSSSTWFKVLDCYTDPLGWKSKLLQNGTIKNLSPESSIPVNLCKNVKDLDGLYSSILELGKDFSAVSADGKGRFAVVMDSASEMLRHMSVSSLAGILSNLRSHEKVSSLFWLLHSDLHESRATAALEYMSSMKANIEPMAPLVDKQRGNSENISLMEHNLRRGKLCVRVKRRNGRVRMMFEEVNVEKSGIKFTPFSSENEITAQSLVPKVQFNLQLSEKERNDRANVVLPFEHQENRKATQIYDGRKSLNGAKADTQQPTNVEKVESNSNKGEIIYFRDSDDEMPDSDEDPDDDLDI